VRHVCIGRPRPAEHAEQRQPGRLAEQVVQRDVERGADLRVVLQEPVDLRHAVVDRQRVVTLDQPRKVERRGEVDRLRLAAELPERAALAPPDDPASVLIRTNTLAAARSSMTAMRNGSLSGMSALNRSTPVMRMAGMSTLCRKRIDVRVRENLVVGSDECDPRAPLPTRR
jgi:hypothetical protein